MTAAVGPTTDPSARTVQLRARFKQIRAHSEALVAPLSAEDAAAQSMPDASPAKWHLAHTTWFFETFILTPHLPGFESPNPAFRALFNSYYNAVGPQFPRPQRGLLTRPSLDDVRRYRRHVDAAVSDLLERKDLVSTALADLVELGLHHEQQHQELFLTDIKHLLSCHPLAPAYRDDLQTIAGRADALHWIDHDEGLTEIGHAGAGFAFDNEAPRHRTYLRAFSLAHRPVSNREFLAFVDDGGYAEPSLWMADGWAWLQTDAAARPLYWRGRRGARSEFTLGGERALDLDAPVAHISWYEADAFARWSNARLPTEAEWEAAASAGAIADAPAPNDQSLDCLQPMAADVIGDGRPRLRQLLGDVWEWTGSAFAPYPGFRPAAGAVGEYNGKFMCNQYVLRGGSCATAVGHTRTSYRNFFPPDKRWQFTGVRLARDL